MSYHARHIALGVGALLLAACGGKVVFEGPPGSSTNSSSDGGGGSTTGTGLGGTTNTGFGGTTGDVIPGVTGTGTGFGGFAGSSTGNLDAASSVSPFTAVSTGDAPPPNQCVSDPDCGSCCQQENPTGTQTLLGLLVTFCGCQANSPCFKQCNGVMDATCTGDPQNPGADCTDCINQADQDPNGCQQPALTKCQGDFNCSVVLQCLESCPN